ncbi:MAG: PTS sugar transporter subunit IIA [Pseudomonadota bacterium]
MRLLEALTKECILPDIVCGNKQEVLEALASPLAGLCGVSCSELVQVIMERERLGSTGIGNGLAIPHGKLKKIGSLILGFGRSLKGVDFDALDGKPTHIFFVLIAPENAPGDHLKMLARISRFLKDESFRKRLMGAVSQDEIYGVIESQDSEF